MMTLFAGDYMDLTRFIFKLYDFDKDTYITPEDIRLVLSYIPISSENFENSKLKFEK
jgi:hypothetical protein